MGHTNQHEISITFPLCIRKRVQVTPNGESLVYHHHMPHTQVQSVYNHSFCWQFPIHLMQRANDKTNQAQVPSNVINKSKLPQIEHNSLQESIVKLSDECLKAIEYFHCMPDGIPPNQIIAIEWTQHIIHRVFNAPNYLVESFISMDKSYLISQQEGQFLH